MVLKSQWLHGYIKLSWLLAERYINGYPFGILLSRFINIKKYLVGKCHQCFIAPNIIIIIFSIYIIIILIINNNNYYKKDEIILSIKHRFKVLNNTKDLLFINVHDKNHLGAKLLKVRLIF
jgi:hypothetical protein